MKGKLILRALPLLVCLALTVVAPWPLGAACFARAEAAVESAEDVEGASTGGGADGGMWVLEFSESEEPAPGDEGAEDSVADDAPGEERADRENDERALEVFYLDEERVDAILIRCEGVCAFVDVGFKRNADTALKKLAALGVSKLDYYIGTHAHNDHIGGAARLIDALRPEVVYIPHKRVWPMILGEANSDERKSCKRVGYALLQAGDSFSIGGATLRCLGPLSILHCSAASQKENQNSLIFTVTYGERVFLFTGDTTDAVLRSVNKRYPGSLRADVFKNPHHSGKHDADVIDLIRPSVTVFCTSNDSPPGSKYMRMLRNAGSAVYVTGSRRNGNVLVRTDGASLDVCCGYAVKSMSLDPVPDALTLGSRVQLTGSVKASRKVDPASWFIWKSSDPSVASVSGGVATAVSPGVATITATSINGLSASVELRVALTSVELSQTKAAMRVGEALQLAARLSTGDADGGFEWRSEDERVAVVTESGEILAAGVGETDIVAGYEDSAVARCHVTVSGEPVKSVSLEPDKLRMEVGESVSLNARVSPSNATDQRLEWASDNELVAVVDESGTVTALGKGRARIGVRAAGGAYAICEVKVE